MNQIREYLNRLEINFYIGLSSESPLNVALTGSKNCLEIYTVRIPLLPAIFFCARSDNDVLTS